MGGSGLSGGSGSGRWRKESSRAERTGKRLNSGYPSNFRLHGWDSRLLGTWRLSHSELGRR